MKTNIWERNLSCYVTMSKIAIPMQNHVLQKKNQKVFISVVPPLFHTLSCSITDTEVNVKKRKNAPTQEETKSQTLIGFAHLVSLL